MSDNWAQYGFSRVSTLIPKLELGNPLSNAKKLIPLFLAESKRGASVITTPELGLTGYTCEDLFHSEALLQQSEKALIEILAASKAAQGIWIVGAPLRLPDGRMLNCAYVMASGVVLGAVPKQYLPNMGEFYERRWFVSGRTLNETVTIAGLGSFLVSPRQMFTGGPLRIGIEICQDLWAPSAPSTELVLAGANVIINISASNEVVGKPRFRKRLVEVQSFKSHCGYFYTSAGLTESSKDTVFSGHSFAYELGKCIGESEPFNTSKDIFTADFDLERIINSRTKDICFLEAVENKKIEKITTSTFYPTTVALTELDRKVERYPFLEEIPDYEEVLAIQSNGLFRRAESANAKSLIIGISGGLDSTLALYVAMRAKALSAGKIKVIGVTMPGPGTSEKTLLIARSLLDEVEVDQKIEMSITNAVKQHMTDMGKSESDRSVVYENAQARERTQILFNLANEHQGMVVGTGDLSELALGWCTFNADHMAHYAVNTGVPKTVVKGLVNYWADLATGRTLKALLRKILEQPISPELLPPSEDGSISQETENLIGSYDLHDFFIHAYLNYGFSPEKILALARVAFAGDRELSRDLDHAHSVFFKRFFSQQFKRSTLPPGPKVHSVSLSPRSDFRLPDELK